MTAVAAGAVLTAMPAVAQQATVNGSTVATLAVGDSTTIHFGGPTGTTASADLFLKLTGVNLAAGDYTFQYSFTNTNSSVSNLVNFGFTTDPTLLGISGTGMDFYLNPNNFPGGYDVDACAGPTAGNNCDAANGQGDLFSGSFTLDFANNTSSITLGNFVDRYASLCEIKTAAGDCPSGEGVPTTTRAVPEPASWALMLIGFAGVGAAMRRSNKRKPALMQVA